MLTWEDHQHEVLEKINVKSRMKLLTKVKDEPELIEGWISHHAEIVGIENLIIADNGSSDINMINLLDKYSHVTNIFHFKGNHNQIHHANRFQSLFDAIARNSDYVSVVDVDERLVGLDVCKRRVVDNGYLVNSMLGERPEIVPATWLHNTNGKFDEFSFRTAEGSIGLVKNLKWGKPIMPSYIFGIEAGIHNVQYRGFDFRFNQNFIVTLLHLTDLPKRRIRVNCNKLKSRGYVDRDFDIEMILDLPEDPWNDHSANLFLREIKNYTRQTEINVEDPAMIIGDSKELIFKGEKEYDYFKQFGDNFSSYARSVFNRLDTDLDFLPKIDQLQLQVANFLVSGDEKRASLVCGRIEKLKKAQN